MTGSPPTATRLCPRCGVTTSDAICATDSTATVDLRAFETANWQLVPGQIVAGKYRIASEIARGGHGTVYRAEHLLGIGTVALKLPGRESTDVMDLRRFFREAQVSARLTGTHTARVFDVGQTDQGALYLAMEYVDGPTLESVLRHLREEGGVMPEAEARRIGHEVLEGLQEAHAAGLVHRDLKPSNIAIRRSDGAVKILDFGLALVHDSSLTPNERAMGTPHYMSPEQCQGGEVDGRADLYALGVILYRMVAGKLPFVGDGTMAVLWGHVHRPVPDVTSHAQTPVSTAFAEVVMRALAKKPERRFANAKAMQDALGNGETLPKYVAVEQWPAHAMTDLADAAGVSTASVSGIAPAMRQRHRSRWIAAWALAGACAAVTALAIRTNRAVAPVRQTDHPVAHGPTVAFAQFPAVEQTAVNAPAALTATATASAQPDLPDLRGSPDVAPKPHAARHRAPAHATAHEAAAEPDWKKPLLPQ